MKMTDTAKYKGMRLMLFVIMLAAGMLSAVASGSLDRFLSSGTVDRDAVAVMVVDLEDGSVMEKHNIDMPLVPASIMKAVTTASLLRKTGQDYRYATRVSIDGDISGGLLDGNLIVEGACDPSLGSSSEPVASDILAEITDALRSAGVKEIRGSVVIDSDSFAGPSVPPTWMRGDLSHAYGTGSHALNYADNSSGRKSVSDPSTVFKARLRTTLANAGISVRSESMRVADRNKRKGLVTHMSPPVDEIMRSCMMRSDNLFAESMLRTYSSESGGDGSTADGASRERRYWSSLGKPLDNVAIVDGSGLSRSNRMTARFMASVLSEMSVDPYYVSFFPLAGQEGTLRNLLAGTPLEGYVAMKTGSMKGIQCYAGYKLDEEYAPTHVVVIMVNSLKGARASLRSAVSDMLLSVFAGEADADDDGTGGE